MHWAASAARASQSGAELFQAQAASESRRACRNERRAIGGKAVARAARQGRHLLDTLERELVLLHEDSARPPPRAHE